MIVIEVQRNEKSIPMPPLDSRTNGAYFLPHPVFGKMK
jgi:hypothetical protein